MKDFEVIDTTADIGLKAYGSDLKEICINLLKGFYYIMFDKHIQFSSYKNKGNAYYKISSPILDELFIKLLEDAIFYIYTENAIIYPCKVLESEITYKLLQNIDHIETEIKAVTMHRFNLMYDKGYIITVIFDI